jgi:hypothetical protein
MVNRKAAGKSKPPICLAVVLSGSASALQPDNPKIVGLFLAGVGGAGRQRGESSRTEGLPDAPGVTLGDFPKEGI